jgi:xanthine dehydrogenase YagS FAD-binding subunit
MRPFAYERAGSIDQVVSLIGDGDGARPLAGGTDLLPLMKTEITNPSHLVDIKRVTELTDEIDTTGGDLVLGALTTLSQLEHHAYIREQYTAIAQAAELAATPQLRNMATVGGNLLQRPRCWYFRNPHIDCWLKGGAECPAREGENAFHALFPADPCVAVHPSDLPSALIAFDAELNLRGANGERRVPLADFFAMPEEGRRTENTLAPDEVIVSVHVPEADHTVRSVYLKEMDRKVWAFALVGGAAVVRMDGERIADARIVLTGVAPIPWRARAAEELIVTGASAAEVAEAALANAQPLEHNAYKIPLAKAVIGRALESLRDPA